MPTKQLQKGEMYISVIIAVGLLLILSQAIISLVFAAYDYVSFSRARTTARHLAQEQMELIRNMPFDEVGTVGGIPAGPLPQEQNIPQNGQNYALRTSIIYVDDPFDDTAPDDLVPNDYKRVRVEVSWGGVGASSVSLISDVAPNGVEQITGGGTLSILVIDAEGEPVPQAEVHIEASTLNPAIDLTQFTSATGRVLLPGAPACTDCYRISVSKDGYSSERTYSVAEIANPINPDVSSLEGQLVEISFSIDEVSTLAITTVSGPEGSYALLPNQSITVRGTKIIGTNEFDDPRYKVDLDVTSDGAGLITIPDLEWDSYSVILPDGSTRMIATSNPLLPMQVEPNAEVNYSIALSPITQNSLQAIFVNEDQALLSDVSVTFRDDDSFEETQITGLEDVANFGQAFFSGLNNQQYTIEATAEGYADFSTTVTTTGNIQQQYILLVP